MNNDRIGAVLRELKAEEGELKKKVDVTREALKKEQAQLTHVQKAIATLTGKPANGSQRHAPTPSKKEVLQDIVSYLETNGPTSQEDLKAHVEAQASSRGQSRTGLAMRFKNALKDTQIRLEGDRASLIADSAEIPVSKSA